MLKIVIIGDSGHSKVIADVIHASENMAVYAKLDDKYESVFSEAGLLKGPIHTIHGLLSREVNVKIIIGIGSNGVRKKIVSDIGLDSDIFISAIHPSAIVSDSAEIGIGTVVMPGAIVNADARIGDHAIVNSGSVIEHDCVVGDYAHISPLAVLTGGVSIGEGTHVGAGASVIPLKKVGKWSTVGAGAVVVSDIDDNVTVVGAPARVAKKEGV